MAPDIIPFLFTGVLMNNYLKLAVCAATFAVCQPAVHAVSTDAIAAATAKVFDAAKDRTTSAITFTGEKFSQVAASLATQKDAAFKAAQNTFTAAKAACTKENALEAGKKLQAWVQSNPADAAAIAFFTTYVACIGYAIHRARKRAAQYNDSYSHYNDNYCYNC